MRIYFQKYQGAGNDFILINNMSGEYDDLTDVHITQLCDRKFGVGADGLIKINSCEEFDFEADYYNADASKSFCGNGGRCAVAFALTLGIPMPYKHFLGFDGSHAYNIEEDGNIRISMRSVDEVNQHNQDYEVYTGSPHYVSYVKDVDFFPVFERGRAIRHQASFVDQGINVNFVERKEEGLLMVRTYERGVEDETLACGTGVTACAIVEAFKTEKFGRQNFRIQTRGGDLKVDFERTDMNQFIHVFLSGPATFVYEGEVVIQ